MTADRVLGAWPAPAKLNLMLRVVGRRADGYHRLQTLFQFIDLCDALYIRVRDDARVEVHGQDPRIAPSQDLIVRAAQSLQRLSGTRLGADIEVHKRIPLGGGLGGGSSNAATTLIALNRLWGLGYRRGALARLALGLGADVPVFVSGRAAFAEGIGELLTPLALPEPWYLVIWPGCSVATAQVFRAPSLTRRHRPIKITDAIDGIGGNHCLPVVRQLVPAVGVAYDWLAERADASLSGTGACVFAPFSSAADARRVQGQLPASWTGYVVRGRNVHPLLDA